MPFDSETMQRATAVLDAFRARGATVATVESCTGGLVGGALTAIAGSSDVVLGGLITYSNEAKMALAAVPEALLAAHGAVSEPVARAMAEGGRSALAAGFAVSVTGVAGPGGGSAAKPVGLVHFACAGPAGTFHREMRFGPLSRDEIRRLSVLTALAMLLEAAEG
ncbi:MAG: nicotinamide-nucleotide amidohydrolase family protein [Bosea sp. (in: a-proteobacteria)]|uniref:CinA family protein n=1 Tax=Bosea sp. (in: a-proteobacteria) TaxID=1871050 RepID=UPI0027332712|nr:nicotinamide-nucleotide amidohydrolase family protein [Bosea sp. (in: a-proteobacteria)]MDP3255687.1 nicotinamide-nucleotide amidohydrolase family protein [Bosea sp. (in: a-proteobacteria)]MDP3321437.1 nicotinamide-nucleotide amidohydrolase family protein [Bosea sp. (in: a-proteobacteria)]